MKNLEQKSDSLNNWFFDEIYDAFSDLSDSFATHMLASAELWLENATEDEIDELYNAIS